MFVGGQPMEFMVDTGAHQLVVTRPVGPLSKKQTTIIESTGNKAHHSFLLPQQCNLASHEVTHEFLYMPDYPVPLMGRDLLGKLRAQIIFDASGQAVLLLGNPEAKILTLAIPQEEEWCFFSLVETPQQEPELPFQVPGVWAEDNPPGLAQNIAPVILELKLGVRPTHLKKYHIPHKAQLGIQKHLDQLLQHGILRPCQSPWNIPLLPIQKSGTDDYRAVQDLHVVNQAKVTLHPVVPNPYTLLSLLPAEAAYFTCLDLKNAFFCIQLAPQSQQLLAYQCGDSNGNKGQLSWTRLPQALKKLPTIFGTEMSSDLKAFLARQCGCTLLQYVDNLLLAGSTKEDCMNGTQLLLTLLYEAGYKVSKKKAQICQERVKYHSFI
uniref:Peptidase A2 domain-containing protein n=1 Tax=Spermophilus dauricus TaxID=99837 RepID=A0A8C9QEJ3_SPEDA